MGKDTATSSSRESLRKRRKNTTETNVEVDMYKKVVQYEEKEAISRPAATDANLCFEICDKIKMISEEMIEVKTQSSAEARTKMFEKCDQICLHIATLKKLNRLEKFRSAADRDALNLEKQKVDSINLQYQNLLYEQAHIVSEYQKCKQFRSLDEDIELIPVEQFLKEIPESLSKQFKTNGEMTSAQKHELHLARLRHELAKRKEQAALCNEREEQKKRLAAEIVERQNRLDTLDPKLSAVLEATKPVQDYLKTPVDKVLGEHQLASLLPMPLYLFYANVDAFKQVYAVDITMEILGDQDEANQWNQSQKLISLETDDSEQENDQQEVEEITETKKRRHRKPSHVNRHEERKKILLEPHPLSVQVTIKSKDGLTLKIHLQFRPQLNIITVNSSSDCPASFTGDFAREILTGESILKELFEDDFGLESPNPANKLQLPKVELGSYQSLVSKIGYAYSWAQNVCGLDFLEVQNSEEHIKKLNHVNVELVIKTIHKRLKFRAALANQLQQLEKTVIPVVPDSLKMPNTVISALTKWTSATWQQYCQSHSIAVEAEKVTCNDLFYHATISRKKAILHALIAIKSDYPTRAPMFSLKLKYNGEHNVQNNLDILDMERAVNTGVEINSSNAEWLLAAQLWYLCACLDIYLETSGSSDFPQTSVFFKDFRGRNRRRPYQFLNVGTGLFIQY